MSEFKGMNRTGLYVMVFVILLGTCAANDKLRRIGSELSKIVPIEKMVELP